MSDALTRALQGLRRDSSKEARDESSTRWVDEVRREDGGPQDPDKETDSEYETRRMMERRRRERR